jgi:hypothetical protein
MKQIKCSSCGNVFQAKCAMNSVAKCPECGGSTYVSKDVLNNSASQVVAEVRSYTVQALLVMFWAFLLAAALLALFLMIPQAVGCLASGLVLLALAKILQTLLSINKHLSINAKPVKE